MDRRERMNDPIEAVRAALDGRQAEIWTALPGIVTAYDPDRMTVSVQPAITGQIMGENGTATRATLPLLVDVPVSFPQGGDFILTFPVTVDDECIVVFSSRCIDAWWQSGGVQAPAEHRMHDLSDGMAILGVRSQARKLTPPADASAVQLRSVDGEQRITITPEGEMSCRATVKLTLEAPQIVLKGALSMTAVGGGNTTAALAGELIATGDVIAGGISVQGHTHVGVQPGGGATGAAQ